MIEYSPDITAMSGGYSPGELDHDGRTGRLLPLLRERRSAPDIRAVVYDFDGTLVDSVLVQDFGFGCLYRYLVEGIATCPKLDLTDPSVFADLRPGVVFHRRVMGRPLVESLDEMIARSRACGLSPEALLPPAAALHGLDSVAMTALLATGQDRALTNGALMLIERIFQQTCSRVCLELLPGVTEAWRYFRRQDVVQYVATGTLATLATEILSELLVPNGLTLQQIFQGSEGIPGVYGVMFDSPPGYPKDKTGFMEMIAERHGLKGHQIAVFGDGVGDMRAAREFRCRSSDPHEAVAVGIVGYQRERQENNARRLIDAGADYIIEGFDGSDLARIAATLLR